MLNKILMCIQKQIHRVRANSNKKNDYCFKNKQQIKIFQKKHGILLNGCLKYDIIFLMVATTRYWSMEKPLVSMK